DRPDRTPVRPGAPVVANTLRSPGTAEAPRPGRWAAPSHPQAPPAPARRRGAGPRGQLISAGSVDPHRELDGRHRQRQAGRGGEGRRDRPGDAATHGAASRPEGVLGPDGYLLIPAGKM